MSGASQRQLYQAQRDLDRLKARLARLDLLEVHEAWTGGLGDLSGGADLGQTHSSGEEGRVWLCPLQVPGLLRARRISCYVYVADDTTDTGFRVGIYRAETSSFGTAQENLDTFAPLSFRLVARGKATRNASVDGALYHADLDREAVLDPRVGAYFIGYTVTSYHGGFLLPAHVSFELRPGFKTVAEDVTAPELPEVITRVAATASPIVAAVRSAAGVQLYGNPTTR